MTRTRWLWLIAAAGLAIFALSFVQGWIIHQRELRGEGYRLVQIFLSAWRGVAIPVTAAASVVALATGLLAAAAALGRFRPPGWLLVGGAAIVVGLMLALSGLHKTEPRPASAQGRRSGWSILGDAVPRQVGWAVLAGLVVLAVTRWPVAAVGAAVPNPHAPIPAGVRDELIDYGYDPSLHDTGGQW